MSQTETNAVLPIEPQHPPETATQSDREIIMKFLETGVKDGIYRPVYDANRPILLGAFCPEKPRGLCFLSCNGDLAATFDSNNFAIIGQGDASLKPYVIDLNQDTIAGNLSILAREQGATLELSTSPTATNDQSGNLITKVANAFKNRRIQADHQAKQAATIFAA